MTNSNVYIIQKDDVKSKQWAEAAAESGIDLIAQPGSPIKAPLFLIFILIRRGIPSGYVVRYLNDYPLLLKTLVRLFSELALVALCKLFRIKLFWICHNLDKESQINHRRVSLFRRWLFASVAEKIFVTDPLLVPYAEKYFRDHTHKISAIAFGPVNPDTRTDRDEEQFAINFIKQRKTESELAGLRPLVLFCAGSPGNKKYLHFDYLEALIAAATSEGYQITAVVAGNFTETRRGLTLLENYRANPDICVFEKFTRFSPDFVRQYVDFYWRGYDDFSVPFTVYEACTFKKPVLALEGGFLPILVAKTDIGIVVDSNLSGLDEALGTIICSAEFSFESFLKQRAWSSLSKVL